MTQLELVGSKRRLSIVAVVALAALMAACGSDTVTPPPVPSPTPVPLPPPRVVAEGSGSLEAGFVGQLAPFMTTLPGRIDATVDWTFATNDVDALLVAGNCSFEQVEAGECPILAAAVSASAKPERLTVPNVAPGIYTFFIGNAGPEDESVSFQIVLTPSAAAASTAPARGQAFPEKLRRLRGRSEIR